MKLRLASIAFALALIGAFVAVPMDAAAQRNRNRDTIQLTRQPVLNEQGDQVGTFTGTISEAVLSVSDANVLQVSGVLNGTVRQAGGGTERIRNLAFGPVDATAIPNAACTILTLDLGPINLNLLGLVVDLSEVNLDITAVPGPGNLLGNLLCALVGLLDPAP